MQCAHGACNCEDAPIIHDGNNYCSNECVEHESSTGHAECPCGHSSCLSTDQRLGRSEPVR